MSSARKVLEESRGKTVVAWTREGRMELGEGGPTADQFYK